MRKFVLLLMFVFAGGFAFQTLAANEEAMVVETKGGNTVVFFFDAKPEMTFAGENVEIKSTEETVLYPMADVLQVRFEMRSTGIGQVHDKHLIFRFANGQLEAEGLQPLSTAVVYSTSGTAMLSGKADDSGKVVLNLDALASGVYIVKAGDVTYKLMKK